MEDDNKPMISKEVSQLLGALFFVVIACPIILVVLLANDIPIADPRLIFWLSAITGLATLYLLNLVTLFLHLFLNEPTYERLRNSAKRISATDLCFSFVETRRSRNNIDEKKLLIALLVIYLIAIRFLVYITWSR